MQQNLGPAEQPEPVGEPAGSDLGRALREARLARGYSLAQVAAATGISKSLLSLIENNRSDITLRRLARLAEHYGTHVVDLLPRNDASDPVVTRRGERRRLHSAVEGLDLHLLVPDSRRKMLPLVAVFAPGGGSAEYWSHEGEELVVVLEGRVKLEIAGSEPVVLERGDAAYYESARPHRWSNVGDGLARLLAVATPPTNL
ncbi:MAG TPA: XRE family transcriptional regulator [Gaiellaceae bacterium]|nr:XRE family transcriptional regulator [Gaiellaceae bacterium]